MEASKRLRFDVIALQETKAKEAATRKTNDGHLIVLGAKLSGRNVGGVGFLVHHRLEHMVDSVDSLIGPPRLAILRLRIDKRTFWSLLDVSVVDAFRTGSDHRLVRAKIRLRARIRRRDFFRPPPIRLPHYDTNAMETAAAHYTWQEAEDLSQDYTMLIEGLRHCAMASAIPTRTDSNGRIDDKARALLQQRAVVHRNPASTPLERATRWADRRHREQRLKRSSSISTRILYDQRMASSRIPTPTQDAAPQIEEWEVEHALRQMKPGKAPGPDRISVDFLKSASRTVIKQLTNRYNSKTSRTHGSTSSTEFLFVAKRAMRRKMNNTTAHRPPFAAIQVVHEGSRNNWMNINQWNRLAGFRKGFCCMDHIHTVTQLIERTKEYKQPHLLLLCCN
ncbi:hypothetical protein COOONC_16809 [Cooperia oncophora]